MTNDAIYRDVSNIPKDDYLLTFDAVYSRPQGCLTAKACSCLHSELHETADCWRHDLYGASVITRD
jgi:hypothetical protein